MLYGVLGAAVFVRVFRRRLDVNGDGNVDMDDCVEACGPRFPLATHVVESVFSSILMKIMITLYQILAPVASNLGVQFPPMVTSALKGFNFLSLDLFPELNLACVYNASYLDQIMFYCLWPIAVSFILLVLLPLIKATITCKNYFAVVNDFVGTFLFLTFVVFVSTSTQLFAYLKCDYFEDIGLSYLEKDYGVECYSPEYNDFLPFVVAMCLVYPVGTPLLYFVLLWRKKRILENPPPNTKACVVRNIEEDLISFLRKTHQRKTHFRRKTYGDGNFNVVAHGHKMELTDFDSETGVRAREQREFPRENTNLSTEEYVRQEKGQ